MGALLMGERLFKVVANLRAPRSRSAKVHSTKPESLCWLLTQRKLAAFWWYEIKARALGLAATVFCQTLRCERLLVSTGRPAASESNMVDELICGVCSSFCNDVASMGDVGWSL